MSTQRFQGLVLVTLLCLTLGELGSAASSWAIERRVEPPTDRTVALAAWKQAYRAKIAPVKRSWIHLSATIRQGSLSALANRCLSFQAELAKLDSDPLPSSPSSALNLHLARGLRRLSEAAERCREEQLFDLVYRLYEARRAFVQVEAMLAR